MTKKNGSLQNVRELRDKREKYTVKNLIIYYSRKGQNYVNGEIENLSKGNTELIAGFIREAAGADKQSFQDALPV